MAYTIVPEVEEGDSWTAKDMNTYVRDNFAAGVPDLFTTKGDIVAATGDNAAVRLPVSTDGYILMANSGETGGIDWTDGVIALQSGYIEDSEFDYSGSNLNTWVKQIHCYNEVFDNSTGTWDGIGKFTVSTDGYYLIGHGIKSEDRNTTGYTSTPPYFADVSIYVNDAMVSVLDHVSAYDDPNGYWQFFAGGFDILKLSSNDYVELYYRIKTRSIGWTISSSQKIMPINIVMLNTC